MSEAFDVTVIGSGPGGYVAAIRAAQLGLSTCLVERFSSLGGTCLNVGCIPSKALLESSELFDRARQGFAQHGILLGQAPTLDLQAMQARKAEVVRALTDGVAGLMKKNKVTVVRGRGRLLGPGRVQVRGEAGDPEVLETRAIILATGGQPVDLPFLKRDGVRVLNSTDALGLTEVPGHLVVVGAGAVGLELGSVWRRLGARVTVVELLPQITPFADKQMARVLQRALKAQGMEIRLKTGVTEARVREGGVSLTLKAGADGEPERLTCDRVLVAVGRRPFMDGLGLAELGVALTESGHVKVDEKLRTSVAGIYAVGDLVPGPALAHKAAEEGVAAAEIIAGGDGHLRHDLVPSVVYTAPELAMVGLTEAQARERGHKVRVGKFLFRANGRAKALGEEDGMVKVVAHADTDRILGVHMVGPRVSELVAEAVVAMAFYGSAEDLARTIHAHPTLTEAVKEAALAVDGRAIHA